jgi:hypothetical protein
LLFDPGRIENGFRRLQGVTQANLPRQMVAAFCKAHAVLPSLNRSVSRTAAMTSEYNKEQRIGPGMLAKRHPSTLPTSEREVSTFTGGLQCLWTGPE